MLVEARSMGLGITFAHQHLGQLPSAMKEAIMHSARSKIVFQTGDSDAREMARALGREITEHDLTHLGMYEAVSRGQDRGRV